MDKKKAVSQRQEALMKAAKRLSVQQKSSNPQTLKIGRQFGKRKDATTVR